MKELALIMAFLVVFPVISFAGGPVYSLKIEKMEITENLYDRRK